MSKETAEDQPKIIEYCFPICITKTKEGHTMIVVDLPDPKDTPQELKCQPVLDDMKSVYPLLPDDKCSGTLTLSAKTLDISVIERKLVVRFQNRKVFSCDTCYLEIGPEDYHDVSPEEIMRKVLHLVDSILDNKSKDPCVPEKIKKALGI